MSSKNKLVSKRFILLATLCVISFALWQFFTVPPKTSAQVRPIYDLGASGLAQKLKRLQTTASAMHTGAHPDDEDSGLIAYLARKEQARVSYLSLNRGEGGQNIIGTELFEPLGVIRTEELLQARRLDGGQQFFTRVMDYGFSKTRAEATRIWGEQLVLGDMVRAIRLSRPLVIMARFSGTPADGHGHHQLAGYLTPIAFKAAADPAQFPEHFAEGLRPWQARKLYVGQGFVQNPNNAPTLTLNTGEYDFLIGRSYFEVAMEGRSQHKSQEMGLLELRGKQTSGLRLIETQAEKLEKETSVFDGVDVSIKGIAKLTGDESDLLKDKLADLEKTAREALEKYEPLAPQKIVSVLAKGVKISQEAYTATQNPDARFLLQQKQDEFAAALQMAAGIVVDTLSDVENIVPGDSLNVAVRTFAPENSDVKVTNVSLKVPASWTATSSAEPVSAPTNNFRPRRENAFNAAFFTVASPANAQPSQPYWLEQPRQNFAFDWKNIDSKNLPFDHSLMEAQITMEIGGEKIIAVKPVQFRYADEIRGEIRRDVKVVPLLGVALDTNLIVAPASNKASKHRVVVSVINNAPRETKGTISLNLPGGWSVAPQTVNFTLKNAGEKSAAAFDVAIPANTKPSDYQIIAKAVAGGQTFDQSMQAIAYPHIQTHYRFQSAAVAAKVLDLKVAPVRVGYLMGSGDTVPEAIRRLGLTVTMLEEKDLASGDLARFDTIVVGVRASQVRPDWIANNNRLLDFVKTGGTLIVQYQQQEYIRENLAPFPAKMESVVNGTQRISNVRVTDENAKVTILEPSHPVFNFPNKIGASDWANWIQERNLYNFSTFDEQYTPLLEAHDENEPENKGGMVYAKIGRGNYIYNSYSFFRQLPTGNPGAYRIFANLLSLPKARPTKTKQ